VTAADSIPGVVSGATDRVRRVSYGLACAAAEQLLADSPVLPVGVGVECLPGDPTVARVVLKFGRCADHVRAFAAAMGVAVSERQDTDGSRHVSAVGRLDTTPYHAYATVAGVAR
jgi:hypothetical protein